MKSISTEDYLKATYKLEGRAMKVTTSALAAELNVADASITDMVKRMSEKGLLRYEKYRGVELTAKGKKLALSILRRHRLWEMFLVQRLGYSWDEVHEEAERLEHVTSDDLEHRIDKALGFPTIDPHGDPIPSKEGVVAAVDDEALANCNVGDVVRISRVSDDSSELLLHAASIGLELHSKLIIKEKKSFDGSMVVKIGSAHRFISKEVAQAIFVREA